MINKIKDFLKNIFRKNKTEDFSDQSDIEASSDDVSDVESAENLERQIENNDEDAFNSPETDFGPPEPNFGPPEPSFNRMPEENITRQTGPINTDLLLDSESEEIEIEEAVSEDVIESDDEEITPEITSSFTRSDIPEDFTARKLSVKEKISTFFSRMKFRMDQVNFKKPNLAGIKLPALAKIGSEGGPILSPSLSKNLDKFLSRDSRETIHQFSLVFLICGITYTLGKVTALVMRGAPALETAKNFSVEIPVDKDFQPMVLNQVKTINIFRTNAVGGGPKKIADTKCEEAQQASSLPIKLINTVVLQDSVKSMASVQVRGDRDLQEIREGEEIDGLAKIFRITRLEILVKNLENGVCESIASDSAEEANSPIEVMSPSESRAFKANKKINGIENVGNKFVISKALLDEKMKDIGAILTQARAIKIQNPDGTLAFKMTEMDPQGIFTYLGLQDQDIITSIDGKPIYDMNEVMTKFAKIKNLDKLQLGIKREGSDSLQDYSIKK